MTVDSTSIVLLFLACVGLTGVLYAHAIWQRRRRNLPDVTAVGDEDDRSQSSFPTSLHRAVTGVVWGVGLLLLVPIVVALAGLPVSPARKPEAFVRTLIFLLPLAAGVFYLRRSVLRDRE